MTNPDPSRSDQSLDPEDWPSLRAQGHRMLDDILDYLEGIRERPVWQPIPDEVRARFREPLPRAPRALADVHDSSCATCCPTRPATRIPASWAGCMAAALPWACWPRCWPPASTPTSAAATTCRSRSSARWSRWMRELFGFPGDRERPLRHRHLDGESHRRAGRAHRGAGRERAPPGRRRRRRAPHRLHLRRGPWLHRAGRWTCPGSASRRCGGSPTDDAPPHRSRRAGGGDRRRPRAGLHAVPGGRHRRHGGYRRDRRSRRRSPISPSARRSGSTSTAPSARSAILAPELAPRLAGIERADSLAFDFHKWGQVPYDAGFVLVRDGGMHRATFASPAAYLRRETRGLAGGSPWPCDFGPDLSRGFRALKTWFTLKVHGTEALGAAIARQLRAGRVPRAAHRGDARARAAGAGPAQHRLLPLPRPPMPTESTRRSSPTCRSPASPRRPPPRSTAARDPRRHRQPPHRERRHRRAGRKCCARQPRGGRKAKSHSSLPSCPRKRASRASDQQRDMRAWIPAFEDVKESDFSDFVEPD